MPTIRSSNIIRGVYGPLLNAGAPSAGTSEVQTLTFGGTWVNGELFTLRFGGQTTNPIAWNSTNATLVSNIDSALEALSTIGTGGVATAVGSMTSGIGTITETFGGNLANLAVGLISVASNASAAGTLGVTETTPGVSATYRGQPKGVLINDTTNGILYENTGTPFTPVMTKVGTQS